MKKELRAVFYFCLCLVFLISGCLEAPIWMDWNDKAGESNVTITLSGEGAERTLYPTPIDVSNLEYIELEFKKSGEPDQTVYLRDRETSYTIALSKGSWTVYAKGFVKIGENSYEASNGSYTFTVGSNDITVPITLSTGIFEGKPGVLNYDISWGNAAIIDAYLKLSPFSAETGINSKSETIITLVGNGAKTGFIDLFPGYYLFNLTVISNDNKTARWSELAHIYSGLETFAVHSFESNEFIGAVPIRGTSSITGTNKIGEQLTVNTSMISGAADSFKYQWKIDNEIISSDAAYTIKGADAGKVISCVITHATAPGTITATGQKVPYTVNLAVSGNQDADGITASSDVGNIGDVITLSYILKRSSDNNRIAFSNINAVIEPVNVTGTNPTPASGTIEYTINGEDADNGVIIINTAFNHNAYQANIIAFSPITQTQTYGAAAFTRTLSNSGSGSGAITWSSGNTSVATVNSATGLVTILKIGTARITATKASDGTYAQATAYYDLTVNKLQLTIANPTVTTTKVYNTNTTAAVTVGALSNKVGSDAVTVTAAADYNSANVAEANLITVVYTISGAIDNYIKPVDYTIAGTITKAAGAAISSQSTVTAASKTTNSITLSSVNVSTSSNPGNQTAEYAINTSATAPETGWQDGRDFNGLTANTDYYGFARAKENANYNAGAPKASAVIKTSDLQANTIAFTGASETKTYGDTVFTKTLSNTGNGSGAFTWSSSDTSVATVTDAGAVTILKAGGPVTITATKASDGNYAQATATYALTVDKRQLTIANPTVTATKVYNGNTTAAVTVGALSNKVGSDVVTVTAAANYNSANAAEANQITVVYTIAGAGAGNYIKPVDYTIAGTITKAEGSAITGTPASASVSSSSITMTAVTLTTATGQVGEYALSATNTSTPVSGWQEGVTITGLTANTNYYVYARSKENANYNAGTAKPSAQIKTNGLTAQTIAFANTNNESKTYGDSTYTKAITSTGTGSGTISYASSDTNVATVNSSGAVTILKAGGPITITATKAADAIYSEATASYTLIVNKMQLTKANPTVTTTKTYNGNTTAAVTAVGALSNVKSGDTVNVTAAANYNSANVSEANQITVVYAINGASADNYIKPVDYTIAGTITKATGSTITGTPASASVTSNSITIASGLTLTIATGQTIEYSYNTSTTTPTSNWQDGLTISGLTANTDYYVFARSKANDNYNAGTTVARSTAQIKTANLQANTIAFTGTSESKTYSTDTAFTKPLSNTGLGSGAITYSSSDTNVATVTNAGAVTILKAGGPVTITATKASDGTYAQATATYTLTVNKLQLTKANPTVTTTKVYNGDTTAAVTAVGALSNVKSGDAVTVTAAANYNTANVPTANLITVVYTISGASADNYIKPVDYTITGTITKATGSTITGTPASASVTSNSITVASGLTLTTTTGQTIEYSYNTSTTTPTSNWQDGLTISGLTANTDYYVFARSKANDNYNAGTTVARSTAQIKTANLQTNTIAFNPNTETKTFGSGTFTKTLSNTGNGTGAITYSSANEAIATVTNAGLVTILKAGTVVITATKAADATYAQATATYTLTISKADGSAVSVPTVKNKTVNSIEVNVPTLTTATGQSIEYAIHTAATPVPTTGWQDSATFSGLAAGTNYYVFARSKANDNYNVGTQQVSAAIATNALAANTIAFNPTTQAKTYGDTAFTKILSNTGSGTGAITYSSADETIATVTNAGLVTILKAGTVVITGTKAADATYAQATATYTLTISKATGSTISSTVASSSVTSNSITITAQTLSTATGQTIEYSSSTTTTAGSWQDSATITGLTANTSYYLFARSKANDNYNAGETKRSTAQIKTSAASAAVPTIVDFETAITLAFTKGGSSPTVARVSDPLNSGKYSGQVSSNGYNQALVVPINLTYELQNYESFSFRFNLVSGNSGTNLNDKQIYVYIAKTAAEFKDHGFGNPAGGSNPEFENKLLGKAPATAVNFDSTYVNKWTNYSISITNPGSSISGIQGSAFVAIGINCQNAAVLMFDDLTFTPKSNFVPPPPPTPPATTGPVIPSTGAVASGNYRNMLKDYLGKTDAEVNAKVNAMWNRMFVNGTADQKLYYEVGSDMAYVYDSGNDDVRSEGMSYGMMMCVQMDDQTRFNKLWKWAYTYMYNDRTKSAGSNSRGYFSWNCKTNGTRIGQGPAPDGEEYFVTALLFAHARWGSASGTTNINNYAQKAREILYDMCHRNPGGLDGWDNAAMFRREGDVRSPGADDIAGWGMVVFATEGASARHTDPSYHLPAFYEVWARELKKDWNNGTNSNLYGVWSSAADLKADADFYEDAAVKSRAFFAKTVHSTTGLGPDYATWAGAGTGGEHADFRYDAFRTVMNAAMDYHWWQKDSWQKTYADRIQAFFESKGVNSYGALWTVAGSSLNTDHSSGLVGCNAVASLAATDKRAWLFLDDFWETTPTTGQYRYYDGSLYMLSLLHVSGRFKAYLSTGAGGGGSSSTISPTSASFDKKTTSTNYKDIAVTMTLNGNTFTNIKNGSTTLTNNTNYTVSGSTVTIKKEYLAAQAVGTTTLTFTFSAGTQTIDITIDDTTNSSITPTTATFNKFAGQQQDVVVTMTLNGNTLSNIKNGNTTLTSGTNYTTSGSTITIKSSYLATLAVGTATLTFNFSVGTAPTIVITIIDVAGGGSSYDFASAVIPAGYPKYDGTISATITGGALVVTKTGNNSTGKITLPFTLTQNLSTYSKIRLNVKGVSGDYTYKVLYAAVGSTNLGSVSNAPITTSFSNVDIPITGSGTGNIEISFWLNMTNAYVLEIKSIELIP